MKKYLLTVFFAAALFACSSEPTVTGPDWIRSPTRTVDNGYVLYVGTGEDAAPERAQFLAEGMALQDMSNECSFIPKGTVVEDHYSMKQEYTYKACAKVAVNFQDCDAAKAATDPAIIKNLANVSFTEQLRRYQDIVEGNSPEMVANGATNVQMPPAAAGAPGAPPPNPQVQFFVMRQYVAYQKEVVVLAPPMAYPPQAPQTVAFVNTVQPSVHEINTYEVSHPEIRSTPMTWSHLPERPANFFSSQSHSAQQLRQGGIHPPAQPNHPPRRNNPKARSGRRRRRFENP